MTELQHPYLRVERAGKCSYGGSQMLSDSASIRRCGCGPVAALDTLWYLEHRGESEARSLEDYNEELSELCRRYFPLLPPLGINGVALVVGLNRLLADRALPYRAAWMLSGSRLWERVEEMLSRDLPVILSVGPNFPLFWQKNRLPFYQRTSEGQYRRASGAKAHFVTATGIDERRLRISSWGREYYIERGEYERYTREHSNYILSNLVYLSNV